MPQNGFLWSPNVECGEMLNDAEVVGVAVIQASDDDVPCCTWALT